MVENNCLGKNERINWETDLYSHNTPTFNGHSKTNHDSWNTYLYQPYWRYIHSIIISKISTYQL